MNYKEIIHQCDENSKLISMISAEEILRLGYSMKLNESSRVLDLCCGYGTHMYFLYRREYEGQALFGLEKLQLI